MLITPKPRRLSTAAHGLNFDDPTRTNNNEYENNLPTILDRHNFGGDEAGHQATILLSSPTAPIYSLNSVHDQLQDLSSPVRYILEKRPENPGPLFTTMDLNVFNGHHVENNYNLLSIRHSLLKNFVSNDFGQNLMLAHSV